MVDSVIQRVRELADFYDLSITALAKKLGLAQPTLNRQITGENVMSLSTIDAILYHFPDLSAEWLLRGEGSMMNGEPQQVEESRVKTLGELEIDERGYLRIKSM